MPLNNNNDSNNEKKVEIIKRVALSTLEELEKTEILLSELQKKKSSLRRDLLDLKEGRLDRIEERHMADQDSKSASIFTVEKKVVVNSKETSPWYIPYLIAFKDSDGEYKIERDLDINNSITRIHAAGTYKLVNGEARFL